jgi:signal transduction histidine kinase
MNEAYLVLIVGAILGLAGAFLGGLIFYQNRFKTHQILQERIEEERTALQNDIAEIDKEELSQTDAGKDLMALSQATIRQFGYPRENLTTSLRRHNYDLLKQIDEHRKRFTESDERLVAMGAMQQELQKTIENLKRENTELRLSNSLRDSASSASSVQIEQNLRTTLEEVARLQNRLADATMRLIEVEAGGVTPFSQELRQTLSSTVQHTDLLLGESVGSLNAMQRNSLETIKASTARLISVMEDFIQVAALKAGSSALGYGLVDLNVIAKEAIEDISSEVRAKRLSINTELPADLTPVYADQEALRQVLIRLLSNAVAASSLQGTVHVRVQIKAEAGRENLLIQISDTGGGIPTEDLPRVFLPLYGAEDVPARGVGETGLGLFMAKTLTEAQNGRIWVDTEPAVGSTYNVLIPITRDTTVDVSADE